MNFYILDKHDFNIDKGFADTEWMTADGTNLGSAPTCPQCHDYIGGRLWLPPYRVELEVYTNRYGNVALGTGDGEFLVDDSFKSRFETTDLTGLEFIGEAKVAKLICRWGARRKKIGDPPRYHVARITEGCAVIDHEKSGTIFDEGKSPTCDYCRMGGVEYMPRIAIDASSWDGTDIFLARGIGALITCSPRFKEWWDSCAFNNCKLIPAEEYCIDFRVKTS